MKHRIIAVVGALFVALTVVTLAYAFSATTVDGIWSEIDTNGATGQTWATGNGDSPTATTTSTGQRVNTQNSVLLDENQVRYGQQYQFKDKSGFGFDGNDSIGTITPNAAFYLGEFTHYNNPINSTNKFEWVDLGITVSGLKCPDNSTPTGGSTYSFTYRFNLDETPNSGTCPYPGTVPCSDKVTVGPGPAASTFTCMENGDPVEYTLQVLGFAPSPTGQDGGCINSTYPGGTTDEFVTDEGTDNYACLWGQITRVVPPVDVSVTKSDDNLTKPLWTPFEYTIKVKNNQLPAPALARPAENVVVTDTLDPFVEYLSSYGYTISPNPGNSRTCALSGADSQGRGGNLVCNLGTVANNEEVTIKFSVRAVLGAPTGGLTETGTCRQNIADDVDVCNLVSVTTTTYETNLGNNDDSEPKNIVIPTAVNVGLLAAEAQTSSILVSWETFDENDIQGFNLYRTTDPNGGGLEQINAGLINAVYPTSGGAYIFTDDNALAGVRYYYHLEVVAYAGDSQWLDASAQLLYRLFLPFTRR